MAITPTYEHIIKQLDAGAIWSFPGGVHPPQRKTLSNTATITRPALPEVLYVPVKQHTGVEGETCVQVGEYVLKGQPLTRSVLPYSVPVHAPTSGTVVEIGEHPSAHPSGVPELAIVIHPDGNDTWAELSPIANYQSLTKQSLIERICDAGIAGLGGAGFPSHIKVAPQKPIEFLIINGIECEPYITSDDRLMREHAWQIRQGIDVLNHLINPKQIIVAVEDNKPEALKALSIACQDHEHIRVISVPTKYPAGGEKQLIQVLTGREVPRRGLPSDVGCVMFNVGTCYAIADVVFAGKPLIERVVTITGEAVEQPQNVWALLGTPVAHLLSHAGYRPHQQSQQQVIMGGPMMGFTVANLAVPVVKITNCLLVPAKDELVSAQDERACIRCGFCTDACPASLLPQQLYWYSKAKEYDNAQEYNLFDCIECGACAYVCPSEIPLVHYYRKAKADIRNQQDADDKAEKAKQRFEARKARLLAEKVAREEKHRLAAEQRKQALENKEESSGAKAKIAAALARAKAKKAQTQTAEPLTTGDELSAEDERQSKVQAAIARAKAKKAASQSAATEHHEASSPVEESAVGNTSENAQADAKQAKIKAAVARAKAKKAANTSATAPSQETQKASEELATHSDSETTDTAAKQAKIKAAVARAKAKKAQQASKGSDN